MWIALNAPNVLNLISLLKDLPAFLSYRTCQEYTTRRFFSEQVLKCWNSWWNSCGLFQELRWERVTNQNTWHKDPIYYPINTNIFVFSLYFCKLQNDGSKYPNYHHQTHLNSSENGRLQWAVWARSVTWKPRKGGSRRSSCSFWSKPIWSQAKLCVQPLLLTQFWVLGK